MWLFLIQPSLLELLTTESSQQGDSVLDANTASFMYQNTEVLYKE
jgi:hypothetical protein